MCSTKIFWRWFSMKSSVMLTPLSVWLGGCIPCIPPRFRACLIIHQSGIKPDHNLYVLQEKVKKACWMVVELKTFRGAFPSICRLFYLWNNNIGSSLPEMETRCTFCQSRPGRMQVSVSFSALWGCIKKTSAVQPFAVDLIPWKGKPKELSKN